MATDTTKRQSWIAKTPGVCGGDACIRNTRITVWLVVQARRLGMPDEEIRTRYQPPLTPDDLEAAWDYYRTHAEEIELAIRANNEP